MHLLGVVVIPVVVGSAVAIVSKVVVASCVVVVCTEVGTVVVVGSGVVVYTVVHKTKNFAVFKFRAHTNNIFGQFSIDFHPQT